VLLRTAGEGNSSPLTEHLQAFAANAAALAQLLSDLSLLCTYNPDLRHTLPAVWPTVMQTVLDAIDAGADPRRDPYQGRTAIADLIPHPQPDSADENPSATLDAAGGDWIEPEILSPLIARWMPIARVTPEAVDALLGLIETTSASWQATIGLQWINELIGDGHAAIASRCWKLPGWLERLRTSSDLRPAGRVLLQRIVDGLATHGDNRAMRLQRLDE
jgi:hypothetical protein